MIFPTYSSFRKRHDVALLVLAVVLRMLLYRIVSQVHKEIVCLAEDVVRTRHANVALLEKIALVLRRHHHPQPNIKLSFVD